MINRATTEIENEDRMHPADDGASHHVRTITGGSIDSRQRME